MSRRQRLVFLESVPSFVRCFSGALTAPNTGCHRKQTNIHLFHSFSWHQDKKEQRNSKRDDDGMSPWVAAGASTVASCFSDVETGKRQNCLGFSHCLCGELSEHHRASWKLVCFFYISESPQQLGVWKVYCTQLHRPKWVDNIWSTPSKILLHFLPRTFCLFLALTLSPASHSCFIFHLNHSLFSLSSSLSSYSLVPCNTLTVSVETDILTSLP